MKEYKINEQVLKTLNEINLALGQVETRGDSTMLMANIRQALQQGVLSQIQELPENKKEE